RPQDGGAVNHFVLETHRLTKSFGTVVALEDAGLSVAEGERVCLLGPSGCGKTTLLRCIAGFESPDSGTIEIGGRVVHDDGRSVPPDQRGLGMVFQDLALWPHLDVEGQLRFAAVGTSDAEFRTRLAELLPRLGIEGLQRRRPHQLSGGQAQRVALARALIGQPKLLLLDEPLSSLDAGIAAEIRTLLVELSDRLGIALVFVTHAREEAFEVGHRIALMRAGRIVQVGSPEELYRRPTTQFSARFLGPVSFLNGERRGQQFSSALGDFEIPEDQRGISDPALCLREDQLVLSLEEGVEVTVRQATYRGGYWSVEVELAGMPLHAHSNQALTAGASVRLALREPPCFVPREEKSA
ncbi:MAG: ABC transporter ATP-binding protein, partial [Planctomycetes bacterium]|nr:ABC transporter ATP-binding protein [Planctomycetota bacterium]